MGMNTAHHPIEQAGNGIGRPWILILAIVVICALGILATTTLELPMLLDAYGSDG